MTTATGRTHALPIPIGCVPVPLIPASPCRRLRSAHECAIAQRRTPLWETRLATGGKRSLGRELRPDTTEMTVHKTGSLVISHALPGTDLASRAKSQSIIDAIV